MNIVTAVYVPTLSETIQIVQADCVLAGRHADAIWVLLAYSAAQKEILHVPLQEIYEKMVAGEAFLALRESDGCLVGYQTLGLWPEVRIVEPRSKVVLPPYRQSGVGTALSRAILNLAVKRYPDWLFLALASGGSVGIWKDQIGLVEITHTYLPDCLYTICPLCEKQAEALAVGKRCCATALVWPGNHRGQALITKETK